MTDNEWEEWVEANTASSDELAAAAADRIMDAVLVFNDPKRVERIVEVCLRIALERAS